MTGPVSAFILGLAQGVCGDFITDLWKKRRRSVTAKEISKQIREAAGPDRTLTHAELKAALREVREIARAHPALTINMRTGSVSLTKAATAEPSAAEQSLAEQLNKLSEIVADLRQKVESHPHRAAAQLERPQDLSGEGQDRELVLVHGSDVSDGPDDSIHEALYRTRIAESRARIAEYHRKRGFGQ